MALLANHAADRAEQLLLVTDRLAAMIADETARIDARQPPADGAVADERNRLANAYRLELARIKQDPALMSGAPKALLDRLRTATLALHETLAAHDLSLNAVKVVSEGLVQAMAEEIVRQRKSASNYSANGVPQNSTGPTPALFDRSA